MGQLVVEVVEGESLVAHESVHALAYHAEAFLYDFFEGAADGHDFSDRLHAGANLAANADELGEVPAWDFADEVVERGGYVGGVGGAHLSYLVQGVAQGYLGGDEGQGVACCLAGQGGGT